MGRSRMTPWAGKATHALGGSAHQACSQRQMRRPPWRARPGQLRARELPLHLAAVSGSEVVAVRRQGLGAKVAALLQNEVAVNRASASNALEAHRKEGSHTRKMPPIWEGGNSRSASVHRIGDRGGAEGFAIRKLTDLVATAPVNVIDRC